MTQQAFAPGWKTAGPAIVVLLSLTLWLYRETEIYLFSVWSQWETGEYTHGYLVLAISIYLVSRKFHAFVQLEPRPAFVAVPIVAISAALWMSAVLADVQIVQPPVLLVLLFSILWAVLGSRIAWLLAFPLAFLIFAMPVWDGLSPMLQNFTADAVFEIVRAFGIPAFQQEHIIALPAGQLSIEAACSGLKYLMAALSLGFLYAYLNYQTFRHRLIVVMVSAAAAVFANIVRVTFVVYIAYKTDMQSPLVTDHLVLGWIIFGVVVALLMIVDFMINKTTGMAHPVTVPTSNKPPIPEMNYKKATTRQLWVISAVTILVIVPPVMVDHLHLPEEDVPEVAIKFLPGISGWQGPYETQDAWMPIYYGAHPRKVAYRKNGNEVFAYLGYYPVQNQGAEVINDLNRMQGDGTVFSRQGQVKVATSGGRDILEQVMHSKQGKQRLVWYWYTVSGHRAVSKYRGKVYQVLGILMGKGSASVTAVATDYSGDVAAARALLSDFVSAMEGSLAGVTETTR